MRPSRSRGEEGVDAMGPSQQARRTRQRAGCPFPFRVDAERDYRCSRSARARRGQPPGAIVDMYAVRHSMKACCADEPKQSPMEQRRASDLASMRYSNYAGRHTNRVNARLKSLDGEGPMTGAEPYGKLKYLDVKGSRMAYVDEGEGDAIVFAHGHPTSSYLWRNVMPHLEGLGRLVAADMIGMGGSDKLSPSGPDRYNYAEQRDYLFTLWDSLDLGDTVLLVLTDWSSALGFDGACQHPDRIQGIAFMEALAASSRWAEFPDDVVNLFQGFRSPAGEHMVLEQNLWIEGVLPALIQRQLSDEEMDHYPQPLASPGEARRARLSRP